MSGNRKHINHPKTKKQKIIRVKKIKTSGTHAKIQATAHPSRLLRFMEWGFTFSQHLSAIFPKKIKPFSWSKKIGIGFMVVGLILVSIPKIISAFKTPRSSSEAIPIRADTNFQSIPSVIQTPTRIIIPSLGIDLPIHTAKLINGYWEVSETTASFGNGSAVPGEKGNSVIFAHAREGLFLPLKNITFGKDIYILNSTQWFGYRVDEIREVSPTDVYVVKKTDDERLTLFTCTGFLDQKRLVVIAKPIQ